MRQSPLSLHRHLRGHSTGHAGICQSSVPLDAPAGCIKNGMSRDTCGRSVRQAALVQEVAGQHHTFVVWVANSPLCTPQPPVHPVQACWEREALSGTGAGVRV